MQNVSFKSVEDFLDYLPEDQRNLVDILRTNIRECAPDIREKLSYNVPYFYRHRRICFIWPSAVPWGNVKLNGVMLGFCYGNQLTDTGYLEKGNRKQVYTKTFMKPGDIDFNQINALIYESVQLDNLIKRRR